MTMTQRKANVVSKGLEQRSASVFLDRIAEDELRDNVRVLRNLRIYRRPPWPRQPDAQSVRPVIDPNLRLANDTLDTIGLAALEFDIPSPLRGHVEKVRELLSELHHNIPRRYASYLMPDGQIAIDIRNTESKNGILIKVRHDGTVTCINDTRDNQRTLVYGPGDGFPDQVIFGTIRELDKETALP